MTEVRLNILKSREVRAFDLPKWLRKQIKGLEREFEKDFALSNISLGISGGIPSGISGSLTVTLTPRSRKSAKQYPFG